MQAFSSISDTPLINNNPINTDKTYQIAINDFLASGREKGLGYLKPDNPDFAIINQGKGQAYDIRQLVINALAY
ncbi:MAG: hypothetical protein OEX11_06920 [Nitrosomonas sp.]|nr:hypothetical protein [Nitrosomonas sp.]